MCIQEMDFFYKFGPFPASFWIFWGSLFILQLTTFCNGDRKQERRRKSMHRSIPHSLEEAQRLARIDSQQFQKSKSIPGFEPCFLGQNAIALPLVPPPRPMDSRNVRP